MKELEQAMKAISLPEITPQHGLAKTCNIDWETIFTIALIERMIIQCDNEEVRDVMIETLERYVKILSKP